MIGYCYLFEGPDAETYVIAEYDGVNVFRRPVDPKNCDFLEWIKQGNTPPKISGNKYVTVVNNVVTFDSVSYNADVLSGKKESLESEYEQRFNELSRAFLNASILNDTTTVTETRTEYQVLLAEYNKRLGEIV